MASKFEVLGGSEIDISNDIDASKTITIDELNNLLESALTDDLLGDLDVLERELAGFHTRSGESVDIPFFEPHASDCSGKRLLYLPETSPTHFMFADDLINFFCSQPCAKGIEDDDAKLLFTRRCLVLLALIDLGLLNKPKSVFFSQRNLKLVVDFAGNGTNFPYCAVSLLISAWFGVKSRKNAALDAKRKLLMPVMYIATSYIAVLIVDSFNKVGSRVMAMSKTAIAAYRGFTGRERCDISDKCLSVQNLSKKSSASLKALVTCCGNTPFFLCDHPPADIATHLAKSNTNFGKFRGMVNATNAFLMMKDEGLADKQRLAALPLVGNANFAADMKAKAQTMKSLKISDI